MSDRMRKFREDAKRKLDSEREQREREHQRETGWIDRAREEGRQRAVRAEQLCRAPNPCDWCARTPTARLVVTPARYENGKLTGRAVVVHACIAHCRQLHMMPGYSDDTKTVLAERQKYNAALRAERRVQDLSRQGTLFSDAPHNALFKGDQ